MEKLSLFKYSANLQEISSPMSYSVTSLLYFSYLLKYHSHIFPLQVKVNFLNR